MSTEMALLLAHGKTEPTGVTVEEVLPTTNPNVEQGKSHLSHHHLHDPVSPFLSLHNPLYSQFTPSLLLPFPHLSPPLPPPLITVNLLLLIGPKFLLCDFQRTIIDSAPNSNHKLTIIIFTFHLNRDKGIWHSSPMKAITDRSQ